MDCRSSVQRGHWPALGAITVVALCLSQARVSSATMITLFSSATYSTDAASMDASLGLTGFLVEDFEDTTLLADLSLIYTGNGFNTVQHSLPQTLTFEAWDGSHVVSNNPPNATPANGTWPSRTTIAYAAGVRSMGVGLIGFQSLSLPPNEYPITDHRLYVNGVAIGTTLESLWGNGWTAAPFGRNGYLRVDAGPGETIWSLGFENILDPQGIGSDVLLFDHVAIDPAVHSVPESGSMLNIVAALVSLAALKWRTR